MEALPVTKVTVIPFRESAILGNIKAMAQVQIAGMIMVRGLRILQGDDGALHVNFPHDSFYRGEEPRYIVECTDEQTKVIHDAVLSKYRQVTGVDNG